MIEFDILSQSIWNLLIFVLSGFFGIIIGNEISFLFGCNLSVNKECKGNNAKHNPCDKRR